MALTNWNDILNKPNGIDEVPEIALTVEQLSASVLSISEDVGEIALDVSQLSASVLTIGEDIQKLNENTVILSLNEPSGIVSSVSGSAIRKGETVEVDIQLTLSDGSSSNWVELGTISKAPTNNVLINISGDGHTIERVLRVNVLSTGTIRVFHGAAGTYNIHLTYLSTN